MQWARTIRVKHMEYTIYNCKLNIHLVYYLNTKVLCYILYLLSSLLYLLYNEQLLAGVYKVLQNVKLNEAEPLKIYINI